MSPVGQEAFVKLMLQDLAYILSTFYFYANLWNGNDYIQTQPTEVSVKKVFFENFANFTGKRLCCSLILIKMTSQFLTSLLKLSKPLALHSVIIS